MLRGLRGPLTVLVFCEKSPPCRHSCRHILRGTMSVHKRRWTTASGKQKEAWVFDYKADGKRKIKTFATRKEAVAFGNKTATAISEGTHIVNDLTVNDASETWLRAVRHGRKHHGPAEDSTLRQYRAHLKHHILPALGHRKLTELTKGDVARFRDGLLDKNLSRGTAKKILTSLKGLLSEAESRGHVATNVAASAVIGIGGRHKKPPVIPTKDEIRRIMAKLDELAINKRWRRWRALFAVFIFAGFRSSEVRGLPWDAVDLKAGTLTVKQRADERGVIGSPTSQFSRRTIMIPEFLVAMLREWRIECGPTRLVFPNRLGSVQSNSDIHQRGWHPLQVAAGVTNEDGKRKLNIHCLRHFRASLLIEDGANPKEVQTDCGHASIQTTFDLYGHLFTDSNADTRRRKRAERLARF
jgi:integrase